MSETPFNQITPAEAERLAMLSQEASRLIQMANKVLHHGMGGAQPDGPGFPNRDDIVEGLADLEAVRVMMEIAGGIDGPQAPISEDTLWRIGKKVRHGRHQQGFQDMLDKMLPAMPPALPEADRRS